MNVNVNKWCKKAQQISSTPHCKHNNKVKKTLLQKYNVCDQNNSLRAISGAGLS